MNVPLLYFLSSLLIVGASVKSFFNLSRWKILMLITASMMYVIFCYIAYGKVANMTPTATMEQIIAQQGFAASSFDMPLEMLMNITFSGGILLNVLTAIWILAHGSLWKWYLTVAVGFCIICAYAGILWDISPLYSLFGGCCALMASAGWVLGLTYMEFCVIGNIWIPCAAIIITALFLVYASCCYLRSRTHMMGFVAIGTILFAVMQIIGAILLLCHYAGTFEYAFCRCVHDLKYLAALAHTSYEAVNIFLWVFLGVSLLSVNIAIGRCFIKMSAIAHPKRWMKRFKMISRKF